jgi:hypothetical protein
MTPPQLPTKPCPHCDSTRFGVVPEFHFEVVCWNKKGGGNVLHPSFTAIVCQGCRPTTLVALAGADDLLEATEHSVVAIAQNGASYR